MKNSGCCCPSPPSPPLPLSSLHPACAVPALLRATAKFTDLACHQLGVTACQYRSNLQRQDPDAALSASVKFCGFAGRLCSLMTFGSCPPMTGWTTLPSASAQSGRSSWSGVEGPHWSVPLFPFRPWKRNAPFAVVVHHWHLITTDDIFQPGKR